MQPDVWAAIDRQDRQAQAREAARELQQGLGRSILSFAANGLRHVAVGNRVFRGNWRTFHDFLRDFFLDALGREWLVDQSRLPREERALMLRWHDQAMQSLSTQRNEVLGMYSAPMMGAARAFLNLAYNIYLIAHNQTDEGVVHSYVSRLKDKVPGIVTGALFETYAAAAFIKAGFNVTFEKECGHAVDRTHVEFVAVYPKTGTHFSVEVKAKDRSAEAAASTETGRDDIKRLRVGDKLSQALRKEAAHTRIVIIELNVPEVLDPPVSERDHSLSGWPAAALAQIRYQETKPFADGREKPNAYVLVTNHPFHNNLDALDTAWQVFATGFKISDFGPDKPFGSYYELLLAREKHSEVYALMDSLGTHIEIPATFDGESPELAFAEEPIVRMRIGETYLIPNEQGELVQGTLVSACVDTFNKRATGMYRVGTGQHIMACSDLTEAEMKAYLRHPDTFFGEFIATTKSAKTIEEFCDLLFATYGKTLKNRLLEFMRADPDFDYLSSLEQGQLAALYVERIAIFNFNRTPAMRPDIPT